MYDLTFLMITVLLADDSEIVRKAIASFLKSDPEIQIVAESRNFRQAIQLVSNLQPRVVVLDVHMDERNLTSSQVKTYLTGTPLVAISMRADEEAKARADSFGAVALLDKMRLGRELIQAIKLYAKKGQN